MKKAIIFDLDGTLLDTLTDIKESVNIVLERNNYPTHEISAYKYFIGNGIEVLTRKALPEGVSEKDCIEILGQVSEEYGSRQTLLTQPYDGIIDLLKELNSQGTRIAILSNKPHEFTQPTVDHFFPGIQFDVVFGARRHVSPKPSPESVFEILGILDLEQEDCFFVGDTSTDIQTGVNADMESVGVSWGFRPVEELQQAGAKHIIDKPSDLLKLIK